MDSLVAAKMDMESLYDYGEEEQDFYEESPGTRKGYPIDHRSIKVSGALERSLACVGARATQEGRPRLLAV